MRHSHHEPHYGMHCRRHMCAANPDHTAEAPTLLPQSFAQGAQITLRSNPAIAGQAGIATNARRIAPAAILHKPAVYDTARQQRITASQQVVATSARPCRGRADACERVGGFSTSCKHRSIRQPCSRSIGRLRSSCRSGVPLCPQLGWVPARQRRDFGL